MLLCDMSDDNVPDITENTKYCKSQVHCRANDQAAIREVVCQTAAGT
jgi:hypothetical protein